MVSTRVDLKWVTRLFSALTAAIVLSCVSPAFARGTLSNEQTLEAERLGEEGVNAFLANQFDKALKPLESGYELSRWGTIGVWLAKTHEKLNQPLDAFRVYSEVAASTPVAGEAAPFARAREDAKAALTRLEASYAVIEFVSRDLAQGLQVTVNGETRRVSEVNELAVAPGEVALEVSLGGKRLPPKSLALRAGQHEVVDLDAATSDAIPAAPDEHTEEKPGSTRHELDLSMVGLTGWTLHDQQGNLVCALPCKWSASDGDTLTVRHGEQKIPVRLGRRFARESEVDITVNPARGSKAWALGLGIPAGVLFAGSLLALPQADYPAVTATAAGVFGAGFGVCAWWFIWSKSRPYLDYEVPESKPAAEKGAIALDFYGNGLGVSGKF